MTSILPLSVIVVDDHPAIRRDAASLLRKVSSVEVVASCGSVKEALAVIPEKEPDLILLDINLGDGSGFDLLEQLPDLKAKVIFLTAYEEYALRAWKTGAMAYLLKPIDEEELQTALEKVLQLSDVRELKSQLPGTSINDKRIAISSHKHLEMVELKDIMYCRGDGAYTTFYLANNQKIVASKYLKEYENKLPVDQFLRTHQSYVVNLSYIKKYSSEGHVELKNGISVPVATRRKEFVRNLLKGNA